MELVVGRHKAMAHPARIRMLALLRQGELCACQLTAILGLAPSTISAHLAELRRCGLVDERREGRWSWSRLSRGRDVRSQLTRLWRDLEDDPLVAADREQLERLRTVPVEVLCTPGFELASIGAPARGPRT